MSTETKKRNKKNVSDVVFIEVYNRSNTAQEVATELGMTLANVYTRAKSLIKRAAAQGVTLALKRFERKIDFAALNEIAKSSLTVADPDTEFDRMTAEASGLAE